MRTSFWVSRREFGATSLHRRGLDIPDFV